MDKLFRKDGYTMVELLIVVAILGIVVVPFFRVILDATYIGNASTKEVDLNHSAQDIFERIKSDNKPLLDQVKSLGEGVTYIEEFAYDTGYDDITVNIRYTNNSDQIGIENTGAIEDGGIDPEDSARVFEIHVPTDENTGLSIEEGTSEVLLIDQAVDDNIFTIKLDETNTNPVAYEVWIIYNGTEFVKETVGTINESNITFKVIVADGSNNKPQIQFLNMTGGGTGKFVKVYEYNDIDSKVELTVTNQDIASTATTSSVFIYSGLSENSESATEIKWYDVEVIFEEDSKQLNAIDGKVVERYVTTIHKDVSN